MKARTKNPPPRSGKLFAEPAKSAAHSASVFTAEIDGASRGNPGPASYAVIFRSPDGHIAHQIGKYIGLQTNNVAEYHALIAALDYAASQKIPSLRVRSDSELLVRQMQGRYKVKSPDLRPLFERAQKLASAIPQFLIEHVMRERNRDADALANAALDGKATAANPAAPRVTLNAHEKAQKLRVRFERGAFHPLEPVELPDGIELEITVHRKP